MQRHQVPSWSLWTSSLAWGEVNGNPLQCSCLENPRDGGAWWAAVNGVAQSQTWLKWLSSSKATRVAKFGKINDVQCWRGGEAAGSLILAAKWDSLFGKLGVFLESHIYTVITLSSVSFLNLSKRNENVHLQKHLYANVHSKFNHNSHKLNKPTIHQLGNE